MITLGLLLGIALGYLLVLSPWQFPLRQTEKSINTPITQSKKVIGFMPFWLAANAKSDYKEVLTDISYFSLNLDSDGHIKKLASPVEEEPGWYTLHSGKMDDFFQTARNNGIALSLTVFSGDPETIDQVMSDPVNNAKNLTADLTPIMKEYGFSDLNLDIEQTHEASSSSRQAFISFATELKRGLTSAGVKSMTVDMSTSDFIKSDLISPSQIGAIADFVLIMAYDYHYPSSQVTGPVAPMYGAGMTLEYDTNTVVLKALAQLPPGKIILGVPLYGYEWETMTAVPHAAIIPGTGLTASTSRVKILLSSCTNCHQEYDQEAQENFLVYHDSATHTYHQFYYPTIESIEKKIQAAEDQHLAGFGLWALGYEDPALLPPFKQYLSP